MFKKGSSILEVIVAMGIFTIIISGIANIYLATPASNLRTNEQIQAEMYLQQGLEATRAIKNYDYNNLTNGTHGLSNNSGYWQFSGTSDTNGQFTRTVTVANVNRSSNCNIGSGSNDTNSKLITVTIDWEIEEGNPTSITGTQYLNNWSEQTGCGESSYLSVDISAAALDNGFKNLTGLTLTNLGASDITLSTITVSWNASSQIEGVTINANPVWDGVGIGTPNGPQDSDTEIDIDDVVITAAATIPIDLMAFSSSLKDDTIGILFTLSDGTARYIEVTPGGSAADVTPPDAISDLTANNPTANSVDLSWTATGDDGSTGTATSYDIRYSTSAINNDNWSSAIQVTGEPIPAAAGSSEAFTVNGLLPSTTYYFAIKVADEVPNESSLSNVATTTTSALLDITPPSAIANLTTANPTLTTLDLTWTATGDDGNTGTATSYDIRYSTTTISELTWASATQVTGEPIPATAGSAETFTVNGLTPNTTYYFAIKVADEVPNESTISNIASGTTNTPGNQASNLSLNSSGVGLASANKQITGLTITNTGASGITIDRLTVSWTGGTNGNNFQTIAIDGQSLFSGNVATGTDNDLTDFTLAAGQTYSINYLQFKKSMSGSNVTLTFTMSDTSTATFTGITP